MEEASSAVALHRSGEAHGEAAGEGCVEAGPLMQSLESVSLLQLLQLSLSQRPTLWPVLSCRPFGGSSVVPPSRSMSRKVLVISRR